MITITSTKDETFKKIIKEKELKTFVKSNIKLFMELRFEQDGKELTHKDITMMLYGF